MGNYLMFTSIVWMAFIGCRHLEDPSQMQADTSGLIAPAMSEKHVKIDRQLILDAILEVNSTFYKSGEIYEVPYDVDPSGKKYPPNQSDPGQCYTSCPKDRWSPLSCTYFCQFPAYGNVVPNIRGCFVRVVQYLEIPVAGESAKRVLTYDEAYDYCVFQDYDAVKKRIPGFDRNLIEQNRAADAKPGVMKWVDDHQRNIFKYLMNTNGNPEAFDTDDVKWVLDQFKAQAGFGAANY